MPDEATVTAPVSEQDSPTTPEAPAQPDSPTQTESPLIPEGYVEEKRLTDTQAELTRKSQLLADIEGRNGPERQQEALAEHARIELEAEEEEEPDEYDLPPDPSEEIAQIRQEMAERDEAAQEAQFEQLEQEYCESTIEQLEGAENFKLSDEEYDFVVNRALANRDPHDGKPDLEGSFKAFRSSILARNKGIYDSKETVVPPIGTEGEPKVDLRDKEARQAYARKVFEAAERAKET